MKPPHNNAFGLPLIVHWLNVGRCVSDTDSRSAVPVQSLILYKAAAALRVQNAIFRVEVNTLQLRLYPPALAQATAALV